MVEGHCECGAVAFEIELVDRDVTQCHCGQCRRTSGHVWAAVTGNKGSLRFQNKEGLSWYQSSDWARRGFCAKCGSSLFWDMPERDDISVAAGCLENGLGLNTAQHIFVKDKGDYYDITCNAEQKPTF